MEKLNGIKTRFLRRFVNYAASLPDVKHEVEKNHNDNRWWPTTILDWKMRMIVAGLSTRVSYASIKSYQQTVKRCSDIGFDDLRGMADADIQRVVAPIGLVDSRLAYIRSSIKFIDELGENGFAEKSIETLIEKFADAVKGASYKVAQCAVLYAKGYHCGVFPVDSGMCEMFSPLLGFNPPPYPKIHEVLRKHFESCVKVDAEFYSELFRDLGYAIEIPVGAPPTWAVHLVLIYYKRLYWNKGNCSVFKRNGQFRVKEVDNNWWFQSFDVIVLEGRDGNGKTTLIQQIIKSDGESIHSPHRPEESDLYRFYSDQLSTLVPRTVLDRTFISEVVYGPILRKNSRISTDGLLQLAQILASKGALVIGLIESDTTLAARGYGLDDPSLFRSLGRAYSHVFELVSSIVPVYQLRTSDVTPVFFQMLLAADE